MHKQQGFTLIEMAIVLIIIGLVAGGVMQGISLMDQAETRRIAADFQEYRQAVKLFQDKYQSPPGDMPNATMIWGRADGGADLTQNCAAPETDLDAANPQATCNGDGDGMIAKGGASTQKNLEAYRVWQHLGNAGLITGRYTGIGGTFNVGTGWRTATPGVNVPESVIKNAGYFLHHTLISSHGSPGQKWTGTGANIYHMFLSLGKYSASGWPWGRTLTPSDAAAIDLKLDDGKPGKGWLMGFTAGQCSDVVAMDVAVYRTDDDTIVCNVYALLD